MSTQIETIVAQIKSDRARRTHSKIDEPFSFNVFRKDVELKLNDPFVRTRLLFDCLNGLKEISSEVKRLIEICEDQYKENKSELSVVKEFQENYGSSRSIRWLTRQSFLSRIFNKAARLQNIDILFLFRFLVHDLEEQLIKNQCKQPMTLYRTQLLPVEQHEILKSSVGGYLMINNFLSTTVDRHLALSYFDNLDKADEFEMKRVIFEIDADPRIESVKPFANIIWLSYCFGQQEVLMMIGSIFRVIEVVEDQRLTTIRLTLSSEQENDLKQAFDNLRSFYKIRDVNLLSFGQILSEMATLDEAKQFYLHLLNDLPSDHQDLANCYQALGNAASEKGDLDLSIEWFDKLRDLFNRTLKPDDPRVADSHFILANIYTKKSDLRNALEFYTKAMLIYKKAFDENHLTIADCCDRIASIHEKEKKYFQALNHYEKALNIRQRRLGTEHLDLATNHSKIGGVRLLLCHYFLALGHFNTALKMKTNLLPADHIDFATDFRGMAQIYRTRGEYQQALHYFQKVLDIYRLHLPNDHPDFIEMERNVRFLSSHIRP